MKRILKLLLFVLIIASCGTTPSFTEVNVEEVKPGVKNFISEVELENGIHLYFESGKNLYVFLNGYNVEQGSLAPYFSDFKISSDENTLQIFYEENFTNPEELIDLKNRILYKIRLDKKYDSIKLFKNGVDASFHTVSGQG